MMLIVICVYLHFFTQWLTNQAAVCPFLLSTITLCYLIIIFSTLASVFLETSSFLVQRVGDCMFSDVSHVFFFSFSQIR